MKVVWSPQALRERAAILDYLDRHDPQAALRIDTLFSETAARLADFPMLSHEGAVAGTRGLTPHRSYRLVYDVVGNTVSVLSVVHSARRWPPHEPR